MKLFYFVSDLMLKRKKWVRLGILGGGILFIGGLVFALNFCHFSTSFEAYHKNAGWEYYVSQEKGFTVQLPKTPIVETKALYIESADKTLEYSEYKSIESSGAYYTISFMDFPSRWRFVGSSKLLSTAFEMFAKSDNTQIISQSFVQHKNYPAIEFTVKKGDEEMRGRLILVGNTFYKITQVSGDASKKDAEFDEFLASFHFPK